MIVLARVIADTDDEQVRLTADAIIKLADLLLQTNISLITQIGKKKANVKNLKKLLIYFSEIYFLISSYTNRNQ